MRFSTMLRGSHAFLSPPLCLAGLEPPLADERHAGGHSIAEIVAHMNFWQRWFLDRCDGIAEPMQAAAAGWPAVKQGDWPAVLKAFEGSYQRALSIADSEERTRARLAPAIESDGLSDYTVGDALIHVSLHNSHHAGQVIILRRQLGAWPPPAGSWTW